MAPTPTPAPQPEQKHALFRVTPLSKYLAMLLFILMPFIGGYVGYTYAPEKVVEVEKIVVRDAADEVSDEMEKEQIDLITTQLTPAPITNVAVSEKDGSLNVKTSSFVLNIPLPSSWPAQKILNHASNTEGVIARYLNPETPGVPDTDVPRELLEITLTQHECRGVQVNSSDQVVLYDSGWYPNGFVEGEYVRSLCVPGEDNALVVYFAPLSKHTRLAFESIIKSTLLTF